MHWLLFTEFEQPPSPPPTKKTKLDISLSVHVIFLLSVRIFCNVRNFLKPMPPLLVVFSTGVYQYYCRHVLLRRECAISMQISPLGGCSVSSLFFPNGGEWENTPTDFEGTLSREFEFQIFSMNHLPPQPLKITLGSFRIFLKIPVNIPKSRFTTSINKTGDKFCHRYRWVVEVANLRLVSTIPVPYVLVLCHMKFVNLFR